MNTNDRSLASVFNQARHLVGLKPLDNPKADRYAKPAAALQYHEPTKVWVDEAASMPEEVLQAFVKVPPKHGKQAAAKHWATEKREAWDRQAVIERVCGVGAAKTVR